MKSEVAPYKVKGLVILSVCDDGALREVHVDKPTGERIHNTLRHRSGGNLKLYQNALRVVSNDEPQTSWIVRKLRSLGWDRARARAGA